MHTKTMGRICSCDGVEEETILEIGHNSKVVCVRVSRDLL